MNTQDKSSFWFWLLFVFKNSNPVFIQDWINTTKLGVKFLRSAMGLMLRMTLRIFVLVTFPISGVLLAFFEWKAAVASLNKKDARKL